MEKKIHFRAVHCQKYRLYQTLIQSEVVQNRILYKQLSGSISLSTSEMEVGNYKDFQFWYLIMYWNYRITRIMMIQVC